VLIDPYRLVCERLYLPLVDLRKELPFRDALDEAMKNQHLDPTALARLQLEKLRRSLVHAHAHSPFWRQRIDAAGLDPRRISSIDDLRALPMLEKAEVHAHGEQMECAEHPGRQLYMGVTSGSTGTALRFKQDVTHQAWVDACMVRGHSWWGVRRGDRKLVLWGRPVAGGWQAQAKAFVLHRLRNSLSFNTFEELTDDFLARVSDAVLQFQPRLIYGYASSIGALALYMERQGITVPKDRAPLYVEYTGDHMFETEKEVAQRVFNAPVGSLYASSEAGSLSYQCKSGRLHISMDHILVEFLRDDGSKAAPGEQAQIVTTLLNNFGMPLFRYRVGDLGSYSADRCDCGVTLPLMNLEVGKLAERITTSSKSLVSSYIVDYIGKHLTRTKVRGIRQFQVEQTGRDDFVLHVVKESPFDPASVDFFKSKLTEYLGDTIRTEVRFADVIPLEATGKRRWFKKSIRD
jgi:phenylacetate-CoA ligase